MKAYILINTELGKVNSVVDKLKEIEGLKSAYPTAGPYDIIAFIESEDLASLGKAIISKIHNVEGISRTLTSIVIET